MEITNLEIMSITNAYKKGASFKLPAAIAWKRRVNMDKLFKARALIEEALREVQEPFLTDEKSTALKDGGRRILPEFIAEYSKAQSEILAQKTDVDIKTIPIEDIGDVELSDADMDTIAFMIKDGE